MHCACFPDKSKEIGYSPLIFGSVSVIPALVVLKQNYKLFQRRKIFEKNEKDLRADKGIG